MGQKNNRADEAERLRPYFAVQLLFAERMAVLNGSPLAEAVLKYTNLHRRLGPAGLRFEAGLAGRHGFQERVDWAVSCYAVAEPAPDRALRFGCFRFDPPDPDGVVRIHFSNRDADDVSPLARGKAARRRAELAEMCAYIGLHHPSSKIIKGMSWLYGLESYRRLFPPAYVATRRSPAQVRLNGTSTWGQLLDHRGEVKAEVRDQLVGKLAELEPTAPWRVFPLQALAVQAPLEVFRGHFADLHTR